MIFGNILTRPWFITLFTTLLYVSVFSYLLLLAELFLSTGLPGLRTIKCIKLLSSSTRRRKRMDPSLDPKNLLSYWVVYAMLQFVPWANVPYSRQMKFLIFAALQLSLFDGQYGYVIVYEYILEPQLRNYEKIMTTLLDGANYIASSTETLVRSVIENYRFFGI